jgi:hypothetical protein
LTSHRRRTSSKGVEVLKFNFLLHWNDSNNLCAKVRTPNDSDLEKCCFIMGLQHEDYSHLDRRASKSKQALLFGTVFIKNIRYDILLITNAKQTQASTSKRNFFLPWNDS